MKQAYLGIIVLFLLLYSYLESFLASVRSQTLHLMSIFSIIPDTN